jgi:pyruvate dehydrogenase E2 component (dihydrolipoamide acetyltransferase)
MARWEFKLPDIGEGVTEGEIVAWLVKPGDAVAEDQPMIEVMTDKATVTITAPKAGTVMETRGKVGEVVPVHAVLLVFELGGGASAAPHAPGTNGHTVKDDGPAATAVGDIKEHLPGMGAAGAGAGVSAGSSGGGGVSASAGGGGGAGVQGLADLREAVPRDPRGYFNEKPMATPATRKLARDMSVDLRRVPPSGPQGRVTKTDVEGFTRSPGSAPTASHAQAPTAAQAPVHIAEGPREERIPFAGMRRKISQKMAQSTRTAAHFTFVEECDATALKTLRARLKAPAEAAGVKLSFLPFIVKATAAALKKHPMLNTALDESTSELVFRKYFHIGIATATEAGLMVPVVKDADRKSVLDIARDIDRLSGEARAGKAKLDDLQGSTFTITSLGAQGGLFATPIINFPEVAILGVHQMKEKPVVKDGQIVIGNVMLLSLSFDHRIVDGHIGAAFAYEIIGYLENPDRLWMEMA